MTDEEKRARIIAIKKEIENRNNNISNEKDFPFSTEDLGKELISLISFFIKNKMK